MSATGFVFTLVSAFMALFPVANPIGVGFILNGTLSELDEKDRSIIVKKIFINYLLIGIGSLVIGRFVLSMFGLALPVVQLGGGFLICQTALGWLSGSDSSSKHTVGKTDNALSPMDSIRSQTFYPFTFPVSIGPGSISVIFTLMAAASVKGNWEHTILNYLIIAFVIFLLAMILYLFLTQGEKLVKRLGKSGNLVINKMVAFFTFCIGIQIVIEGVDKIFHLSATL